MNFSSNFSGDLFAGFPTQDDVELLEILHKMAHYIWLEYSAFLGEGFDAEQAFWFVKMHYLQITGIISDEDVEDAANDV